VVSGKTVETPPRTAIVPVATPTGGGFVFQTSF
jgi:hypothetical protein